MFLRKLLNLFRRKSSSEDDDNVKSCLHGNGEPGNPYRFLPEGAIDLGGMRLDPGQSVDIHFKLNLQEQECAKAAVIDVNTGDVKYFIIDGERIEVDEL
jgi:hypothetical protein